ncbi:MAG: heavy metal translocating P-type ATPase [Coprobacillaceae bacterium]
MKQKFNVKGMTCSACEMHVTKGVEKVVGVNEVDVNLLTNSMQVTFDDTLVNTTKIIKAVQDEGYDASIAGDQAGMAVNDLVNKKKEVIISFVLLAIMMYVSMSNMVAYPIPSIVRDNILLNIGIQILLLIPITYIHRNYFINGFKMLFRGKPNMDSLIALGGGTSIIYSIYSTILIIMDSNMASHMMHSIYFESAATIVVFISFGKYLESKSKQKTTDAISKLLDLAPKTAILINDGEEKVVPVEELVLGDKVLVKANSTIPVDGIIVSGQSSVDEAMITGESLPIEKEEKGKVIGGTYNLQGSFVFEVSRTVENSTLAKIIALVEEASSSKAPITSIVDKVVGWFVPTVIVISIITLIAWLALGEPFSFALSNAIAVLVISCPCALGLATPVAIMVATGVGAKNGILLKSASVLENERNIDVVVLDKTGTITKGKAEVSDIYTEGIDADALIQKVASLEKGSSHILANAFLEKAEQNNIDLLEVSEFKSLSGLGLQGRIDDNTYIVGNHTLMKKQGINISSFEEKYQQLMDAGKTCVFVADENQLLGVIGIYDAIKETSIEAIQMLKDMGIKVMMLTGDSRRAANALNKTLQLDAVIAEVLPEDKENEVKKLQAEGYHVLMVGDGINDAPALVRSDVGLAVGAGNDIAIDSADVILMKDDLRDIITSIRLSKQTVRNIKQNLFWAFIYNCIGIPIAAGVFYYAFNLRLDAMFAAAAMSLSSVCVVSNALRLRNFKVLHNKEIKKMKKEIMIEGMSCAHCSKRVEDALSKLNGTSATVNLDAKKVVVETTISDDVLKSTVENAGYEVVGIKNV